MAPRFVAKQLARPAGLGGLPALLGEASFVCGVDRSPDVVKAAQQKYRGPVHSGKAEFKIGAVENLPLPDGAFDKVLSVNTVYFWASLDGGAREIHRVLNPGGRAVLGFVPKKLMDRMNMPRDIFTPREPEDVVTALAGAGLAMIEVLQPKGDGGWMVAVGVRR